MKKGYFTFVLHSHLPYVRNAGRWPHGEEMIHEAIAETYIPLLNAIYDLKEQGIEPKLTVGLTPVLLEQISDKQILDHFELYLLEKIETAAADGDRFQKDQQGHLCYLAGFYHEFYSGILRTFRERYERDIVGAFKRLQLEGNLDIITSAATHGYLPLIERDSSIYGQLKVGMSNYERLFGQEPAGIWLPECGYRPSYYKEHDSTRIKKPGLEEFLADLNLKYFFVDTHQLMGGAMVGKVAGDVIGPYGGIPARQLVMRAGEQQEAVQRTTFRPYYVQSTKVAVFGRNERTGLQVWSAAHGYPGDFAYREFHKKDHLSGFQYWRVTDASGNLGSKDHYDPYHAFNRVYPHAEHFVQVVTDELMAYGDESKRPGIIVSAYDTELFGHWWFEGIAWLKEVMRLLAKSETVELTNARDFLAIHQPDEILELPESSWGMGGGHYTWSNEDTAWLWPLIHNAERQMEKMVDRYPDANGEMLAVLNQAARELLLLESSDWPFLISTGQAREYAAGRFQAHLARFNHLVHIVDVGQLNEGDEHFLQTMGELDNPFPNIDYRVFAEREGRP